MIVFSLYSASLIRILGVIATISYCSNATSLYAILHKPSLYGFCTLARYTFIDSHAAFCVTPTCYRHLHVRILFQCFENIIQFSLFILLDVDTIEGEIYNRESHLCRFFYVLFNNSCFCLIHGFFLIDLKSATIIQYTIKGRFMSR